MISTKNIVVSIEEVPSSWIMETYIPGFSEKLIGQDVMIKSVFNPDDKTPSMSVFLWKNGKYRFNDFSTGIKGDGITLVMELNKIGFAGAVNKILKDYNDWVAGRDIKVPTHVKGLPKFKPVEHPLRGWSGQDGMYWRQFGIASADLDRYNVKPLEYYILSNGTSKVCISGFHLYGYFNNVGQLYKIYQPMIKDKKFIKNISWVQGYEQLKRKSPVLVITKALKDVICLGNLKYEAVAPDSENSLLPEDVIKDLKASYTYVVTLFDRDQAGIKGMNRYKEEYGFESIHLDLEKDVSDSIKKHGKDAVEKVLDDKILKVIS